MPRYITVPVVIDAEEMTQQSYEYIRAHFPNWIPASGNLDTWILQAVASEASDLMRLASEVPQAIFRYFGSSLLNLQPIAASPAVGETTWTAENDDGYTISAGTVVGLRTAGDELIPFLVTEDVVIPPGSTATATGAVPIEAVTPGAAGSGLGSVAGPVELITPLVWVTTVTIADITTGGVDDELDDDYLDRLRAELQLMSPRPILPDDFSALAREHASVLRATTIDGYNPANSTFNNERMVAVAIQDITGAASSSQVKSEVQAALDALREVNFVVNVIDPVFRAIQVTYTIKEQRGRDVAEVIGRVNDEIATYLSPVSWGLPEDGDPRVWINSPVVRYLELATLINGVQGVDYVGDLFVGLEGGALAAADYTMVGGVAMLPTPGTISGAAD